MKDLVNIQDYLVDQYEIGDWDGEEELVADKLNELLHYCWDLIPDDMATEQIEQLLAGIWDNLRGDTLLLDVDIAELQDWVVSYMHSVVDNQH